MTLPAALTRHAAFAGLFYPDDPQQLRSSITQLLDTARQNMTDQGFYPGLPPKAIIAPHAGYIYSGPIAASAYTLIEPVASSIKKVVLLGPSHRFALHGIASPLSDYFETPLGSIPIDQDSCQALKHFNAVEANDMAHQQEHSLEVHLPFLQCLLDDFSLIPLVVGDCNATYIVEVLDFFFDRKDTLIIISTDLSHFHDYLSAQVLDQNTSKAIQLLQPENIHYENACGRNPLNGLLTLAKQKNLSIDLLDLRNSGDTAGNKDRVVGYGAYVVH